MGYIPPISIDIGSAATDRGAACLPNRTYVDKNNPANESGIITSVEIWANTGLGNVEVAIFYVVSGNNLSTRDSVTIGSVTAGSKQTFSVNLNVQAGDYIGLYCISGNLERDLSGVGYWWYEGDAIPCTNTTLNSEVDKTISLYGTGGDNTGCLTIGESFSTTDSLIKNVIKQLTLTLSIADSSVKNCIKQLTETFNIIDSWAMRIYLSESFGIVDSLIKNAVKQLAEILNAVDSWILRLNFSENLHIGDSFKRFFYNIYTKITKAMATYIKIDKDISDYTKISKDKSDYTKKDKERGEE